MKRIVTTLLLLVLGASSAAAQEKTWSPQQILDKMVSVYASCRSYVDEGQVKVLLKGRDRPMTKPFSTAFVRPSRFRFEFEASDPPSNYVVWRDGISIKSWWSVRPRVQMHEVLSHPLANGAGISSGSTINVPGMLMSDMGDTKRIQDLTGLSLKGEEKLAGKVAFRIEGRDWRNDSVTIWIDRETFLLLKIYEKRKTERFESEQTTTYKPRLNTEIPPGKLAFNH